MPETGPCGGAPERASCARVGAPRRVRRRRQL